MDGSVKMSEQNYHPSGVIQGDTSKIPDKGSKTGVTDGYGADLGVSAMNKKGGIGGSTGSDGMQQGGLSKNKR